ncbi:hypothetical protein KBD61_04335 [Patescibacteria group bacterium]|nr:hypothetical protein [Patescibacteria group bacterium]
MSDRELQIEGIRLAWRSARQCINDEGSDEGGEDDAEFDDMDGVTEVDAVEPCRVEQLRYQLLRELAELNAVEEALELIGEMPADDEQRVYYNSCLYIGLMGYLAQFDRVADADALTTRLFHGAPVFLLEAQMEMYGHDGTPERLTLIRALARQVESLELEGMDACRVEIHLFTTTDDQNHLDMARKIAAGYPLLLQGRRFADIALSSKSIEDYIRAFIAYAEHARQKHDEATLAYQVKALVSQIGLACMTHEEVAARLTADASVSPARRVKTIGRDQQEQLLRTLHSLNPAWASQLRRQLQGSIN